jgi:hypothetical protein
LKSNDELLISNTEDGFYGSDRNKDGVTELLHSEEHRFMTLDEAYIDSATSGHYLFSRSAGLQRQCSKNLIVK